MHAQVQERLRQHAQRPLQPILVQIDVVYLPDLPGSEVEVAVGADAMSFGAVSGFLGDPGRLLRTQAACLQSRGVLLYILFEYESLRPPFLSLQAFWDAICDLKVGCCCESPLHLLSWKGHDHHLWCKRWTARCPSSLGHACSARRHAFLIAFCQTMCSLGPDRPPISSLPSASSGAWNAGTPMGV